MMILEADESRRSVTAVRFSVTSSFSVFGAMGLTVPGAVASAFGADVAGGGAGVASVGGVCAVAAKAITTVPDASNCLRVEGIEYDCMGEIHFGAIGEPQPPTRR
jgi:hypothetical protein